MEDEAIARIPEHAPRMDLVHAAVQSYVRRDPKSPAKAAKRCCTTHTLMEVLFALGRSAESVDGASIPATADIHVEYMLGLAARGLIPKVFWWCTPEVLAILDGARRVAAAAGARAEAAKAFAVQCIDEMRRSKASSAVAPRDATPNKTWGADKWTCPHCKVLVRRSNKSLHLRRCPKVPVKKGRRALKKGTHNKKGRRGMTTRTANKK